MPSAFDAMFSLVAKPLSKHFNGEAVIYTPRGGEAETITAIVDRGESIGEFERADGRTFRGAVELDVDIDDCPNVQAGDKFRIDDVDYFVDKAPRKSGSFVHVIAVKLDQREKGTRNRFMPTGG